jgi:signal transduction histidine kinase
MSREGHDAALTRLASLGEIAAEVAHELRNVLQVISSSAFVTRQELERGDATAALHHVHKIEKSARAAHAIVDDVMALARGEALSSETVSTAEAIAAARAHFAPGSALWDDSIEPRTAFVRGHAGLLVRLLHVLYENAIQSSAPRAVRIFTRVSATGRAVAVEVGDDGAGMPPETAARVFEPFVSTRPGGTGLGLSLARRIAHAHGGSIALVEVAGEGATFRVELPQESG